MSRLEELITEYCPNGVEYKKVRDVYTRLKGTPITARKMKEIENVKGNIKIFAGGKTVIDAMEQDIPKANITRVPAVLVQSRGVIDVVYYDKPFTFKNEMWAYTHEEKITVKYLFHVLKNSIQQFREAASGMGSLPQISLKVTEEFMLPVPPLEVQREIVRVLDSFTLLTAELTAELTARKKQYDFYRDKLLTFEKDIPVLPLKEVVKKGCAGATPAKGSAEYYKDGTIPWIRTQDVRFNEITEVDSFITEKAVEETAAKWIPENCVIVAISGATAGRCAINKIKATTNQHCLNMQIDGEKALYKYVYYCICSKQDGLISKKRGARGDLNSSLILGIKIPVPNLELQKRIVHVLDNFESICADLHIGLPAEIEARQKQYEYYRDLLLTFAETSSTLVIDRQTDRQTELSAIKLLQYVFGYATVSLDYLVNFRNGKGHEKNIVADGKYIVVNSKFISTDGQVKKYANEQICPLYENDILMVMSDLPNGRALAKCYLVDEDDKYTLNQRIGAFTVSRPDLVTIKYLYYMLNRNPQLLKYDNGADQTNLRKADILNITIAIPAVKEQEKITEILDRFDTLCNDLTTGLPAEIEARQKQYEYYRDKLLSFEEKGEH